MKAWTRQVPEVWKELQEQGVYYVKREYIERKNDTIADFILKNGYPQQEFNCLLGVLWFKNIGN